MCAKMLLARDNRILLPTVIGVLLIMASGTALAQTIIYQEGFGGGSPGWYPDNGVWQIGEATVGPVGSGVVAGTVLGGNYPFQAYSRLISPWITLPASPQDGALWLRFSQWFNLHTSDGIDIGRVQIRTNAPGDTWADLSNTMQAWSPYWTEFMISLAAYAGSTVQIAFLIDDADGGATGHNESHGWYIDDVLVLAGKFADRTLHTFDDALDDSWEGWYAQRGCWEIGRPASGVATPRSGTRCAGTNLHGSYPYQADSRLISPSFVLPAAPRDEQIWLSFWSWSSFSASDGTDYGQVEVQVDDGPWDVVQAGIAYWANCWSPCAVDLSAYAGQTVRLAFHVVDIDGSGTGHNESHGWFIDDVAIREGRRWVNNVDDLEGTITGWSSTQGLWQMGVPTSGPGAAHSGQVCWGTNLAGNYGLYSQSSLGSTWIDLPTEPPVVFSFWHWFAFSTSDGVDYGRITVHHAGGDSVMTNNFVGTSGGWTQYNLDLSAFAGQLVRIFFSMYDVDGGGTGHNESSGWYLDDFSFVNLETSSPQPPILTGVTWSTGAPVVNYYADAGSLDQVCIYVSKDRDDILDLSNRIAVLPAAGMGSFTDSERPGWGRYYYSVTGVDALGHESAAFGPELSGVDGSFDVPARSAAVMHGSHPNPFNPQAEISFTVTQAAHVVLEVFDLRGRLVARLLDEPVLPGLHAVPFGDRRLASGAYLARLQVGGEVRTCKMMLAK
ncbi:MAG: T9SS type A sorting domain-containing protein [Krumholzibacteria bacterium]|nr:T9SS type A sorting domain-containing protein [Candidatus Krumholzibacteria bacterium]